MTDGIVTVAIPVRDGAVVLERTLAGVAAQQLDGATSLELVVCDSGSRDGSVALARSYGAEVIEIAPDEFCHGETRNLLMERSHGAHVAFLTQDALPADVRWLARLLAGFALADDVALVSGPYRPRSDASPMVARELTEWFCSFSSDGAPRVDRLAPSERTIPSRALLGPRGFFTDANGAVARAAWEVVPFRPIAYAEDHMLAHDMLRAGYAKAFLPGAAVIHSHEYSLRGWLRRSFDEARAMRDVYGWVEPLNVRSVTFKLWGRVGADWRWARAHRDVRAGLATQLMLLSGSAIHHAARTAGAVLGSHADRLPPELVRRLSLEHRVG